MHLRLTGDTSAESGLDPIFSWSEPTRKYFVSKHYGNGLLGVVVVLMCQDPALNLKRRVRFSKKEKKLYLDIMLDLNQIRTASPSARKRFVVERLSSEIPELLKKYRFLDFDEAKFVDDLRSWLRVLT